MVLHCQARGTSAHTVHAMYVMGVRTASVAGLLLVLFVALAPTAWAQQRAVGWQRYDVDLAIAPDGSVAVTETQTIQFQGTFQMGFRVIPTDRVTSIDNVGVAEVVNGQTVPYRPTQTQTPNGFSTVPTDQGLEIDWWFPPTTNAARTFVLRYTLHGALRIYDAGDQLQWKAIYADRTGPVAASSVTVHLPGDVPGNALLTSYSRYTASQAARANALPSDGTGQQTDPRTVQFGTGQLPAGTGVEVRVQFPHRLVSASAPPWQADADRADWIAQTVTPIATFLMLLVSLVVLVGGGVGLFIVWYTSGRDPSPGAVPPRLEQPPSTLPAPLAGTLIDEVADVQDTVATLVDLAGRGVLSMTDVDNPQLPGALRDVRIMLHEELPNDAREYERLLVRALFGAEAKPGDEVVLSQIGGRFAAAIPALQASLYREVADEGWFVRNPEAVRQRYRQLGWVLVGVGVACAIVAAIALGWARPIAWLPGLTLALVGVGCVQVARAMPRRTRPGALEARGAAAVADTAARRRCPRRKAGAMHWRTCSTVRPRPWRAAAVAVAGVAAASAAAVVAAAAPEVFASRDRANSRVRIAGRRGGARAADGRLALGQRRGRWRRRAGADSAGCAVRTARRGRRHRPRTPA
jgi:hypothetical protein